MKMNARASTWAKSFALVWDHDGRDLPVRTRELDEGGPYWRTLGIVAAPGREYRCEVRDRGEGAVEVILQRLSPLAGDNLVPAAQLADMRAFVAADYLAVKGAE